MSIAELEVRRVLESRIRFRANGSRWTSLGAVLSVVCVLAGCGGESKFRVYPVSGKVLWGSEPAAGVLVVLHPVGKAFPEKLSPSATTDASGNFQINSYSIQDGAPAGEYVATTVWFKPVESPSGFSSGPNVLPPEFAKAETSPLKVTIEAKSNDLNPFEIPTGAGVASSQ